MQSKRIVKAHEEQTKEQLELEKLEKRVRIAHTSSAELELIRQEEKKQENDQTITQIQLNEEEQRALRIAEGRNFLVTVWFTKKWATTEWTEEG